MIYSVKYNLATMNSEFIWKKYFIFILTCKIFHAIMTNVVLNLSFFEYSVFYD
jgi:hypothetical protein